MLYTGTTMLLSLNDIVKKKDVVNWSANILQVVEINLVAQINVLLVPKYHILDEIFFLFYCQDEDHSRVIKAQELPDFSNVFQPELPHCHTESEPFSFDQRDKELKKKKEEAVKAIILEEEKKVWSFLALKIFRQLSRQII